MAISCFLAKNSVLGSKGKMLSSFLTSYLVLIYILYIDPSMVPKFSIEANILDPVQRTNGYGRVVVENGRIATVIIDGVVKEGRPDIMPGFIDAHIHIESSML